MALNLLHSKANQTKALEAVIEKNDPELIEAFLQHKAFKKHQLKKDDLPLVMAVKTGNVWATQQLIPHTQPKQHQSRTLVMAAELISFHERNSLKKERVSREAFQRLLQASRVDQALKRCIATKQWHAIELIAESVTIPAHLLETICQEVQPGDNSFPFIRKVWSQWEQVQMEQSLPLKETKAHKRARM